MTLRLTVIVIFTLFYSYSFSYIQGWRIFSVRQPVLVDPNSTFNVPITVVLDIIDTEPQKVEFTHQDGTGKWYFGICLPKGWVVEDSISFSGALNGSFIYSNETSDSVYTYDKPPDGYYWWLGASDNVDSLYAGKISYTPRINTDEQSGIFFIDYIISDSAGIFSFNESGRGNLCIGQKGLQISVGMPMTTVTVSNTNNDGDGSLRQAINEAESGGKIIFDLPYPTVIKLNSEIVIDRSLSISGPDSGDLTLSGKYQNGIFLINGNSNVNISNLNIENGKTDNGGGIRCYHSNLNLENVTISNCYSSGWGGGLRFEDGYLKLTNVIISDNEARLYGGGVWAQGGIVDISYSEFTSNYIEFFECYTSMNNVTIIDGGIIIHSFGLNLINSIIWYNSEPPIVTEGEPFIGYLNIAYSNIQGGLESVLVNNFFTLNWLSGNIDVYPAFVNTEDDDYRLQSDSPCIDAGVQNTFFSYNDGLDTLYIPPMDYVGGAPDMGAYEFGDPLSIEQESDIEPSKFTLSQNYPNPFNPKTIINYTIRTSQLPTVSQVDLSIFNILGQKVATLVSKKQLAGTYEVEWDASGFASGVYYYNLKAGDFVETKKLILIK